MAKSKSPADAPVLTENVAAAPEPPKCPYCGSPMLAFKSFRTVTYRKCAGGAPDKQGKPKPSCGYNQAYRRKDPLYERQRQVRVAARDRIRAARQKT